MKKKRIRPLDRRRDIAPPSMQQGNIQVLMSLQKIAAGDVILLHVCGLPPHPPLDTPLLRLAFGNPDGYDGSAFIIEPSDLWSQAGQEPTADFNCHAYSLGSRVGLAPGDWVEGEPTNLSLNTNPMAILLSVYFRAVKVLTWADVNSLAADATLREGDIVSFTRQRPFWGTVHDHSGLIKFVRGENWIVSKLRTGRLLAAPITEVLELYPQTQLIRIYRFRADT